MLSYLEEYFVDSGYRERIKTLFGIDGVKELRKVVELSSCLLKNEAKIQFLIELIKVKSRNNFLWTNFLNLIITLS